MGSDGPHWIPAKDLYNKIGEVGMHAVQESASTAHQLFELSGYMINDAMNDEHRAAVKILLDGAATFDAMSPQLAAKMGYEIEELSNPLTLNLGAEQSVQIPRRITQMRLKLKDFSLYEAYCFVTELPEGIDVLLGTPWHRTVNPDVNWDTESVRPRPRVRPAEKRGGCRRRTPPRVGYWKYQYHKLLRMEMDEDANTNTKFVAVHNKRQLKKLLDLQEGEFAFFIRTADTSSEKAKRQTAAASWEALDGNPAYEVCLKYKDSVFKTELPKETPRATTLKARMRHRMEVEGTEPIHVKQFRLSPEQQTAVSEWVKEMLAAGLIRPSNSPFCAPTFAVRKAVGWRIVHDYRRINQRTRIPQPYALRKEDIFDTMAGSKWFSTCDLLHGYYQQFMHPADIQYTGFSTPMGQFEYIVMPQGLSGAPGSFNRLVQRIFKDMHEIVRVYFDDAFIFTKSMDVQDHLIALDRFLARCAEQQLYLKLSKCTFCATEIPALGDFIGRDGVRLDPDKIRIITEWPTPQTKRHMKQFLGTIAYNAKYIKDYGQMVAPLHRATRGKSKNEKLRLQQAELESLDALKRAVTTAPCLALPDFSRPFIVRMDASNFAIGGGLHQKDNDGNERVVAYSGRKLTDAELNYDTRERELLAIIYALRKWRVYLLDQEFIVETDHHSLQTLLTQNTCSRRLARWLSELCEFNPRFKWIAGATNDLADGLSRRPDFEPETGPASSVDLNKFLGQLLEERVAHQYQHMRMYYGTQPMNVHELCRTHYAADPFFGPMEAYFKEGRDLESNAPRKYLHYRYQDSLLWFLPNDNDQPRLCVPKHDDLRDYLIYLDHDEETRGHAGEFKTTAHLQKKYYWKQLGKAVKKYIQSCEKCQRNKTKQTKLPGELHPHTVPQSRWTEISMDFITSLPMTARGHNMLWVIVDRLTKRIHLVPVADTINAKELLVKFRHEYQRLHGLPTAIVSDRDHLFTSSVWSNYMAFIQTELKMSTAFRSTVDGQTEIVNRFVEDFIRNYIDAHHVEWDQHLDMAEFSYNSRYHSTIGMSPFKADLGIEPRSPADVQFEQLCGENRLHEARDFLLEQQVRLELARECMAAAQTRMKHYHDRNRPIQRFEVGDQVLLSTKNLSLPHSGVAASGSRKFAPKRIGPFEVIELVKRDTYRLRLPSTLRLHDCFHTSLLAPYHKSDHPNRMNPPNLEVILPDGGVGYIVEAIVGLRRQRGREMAKVRWLGYTAEHDTWEPVEGLQNVRELIEEFRQTQQRRSRRNTNVNVDSEPNHGTTRRSSRRVRFDQPHG